MVKLGKKADETTNEQVITGASATVLVEGHLTKEQEKRELISCGRLRRDAPGADKEEKDAIDSILDSVKKMDSGESKSLTGEEAFKLFQNSEKDQAKSKSRRQKRSVKESLSRFCDEYAGRIRVALVRAMEAEEVKNSQNSFTSLSDWDFSAPCSKRDCNGRVHSNILLRKQKTPQECYCGEMQNKLHLYDKMEDNSNLFHTVSEWVAESILKEVCKSRYNGRSGFSANVDGIARRLSYSGRSSKRVERAIGCIITINEYIGKTDFELEEIHIGLGGKSTARQISQSEPEEDSKGVFYALASVVRDEIKHRIRSLRSDDPTMSEPEGDNGTGKRALDDWAEKISTHILYAVQKHDGIISIQSSQSSDLASPGERSSILKLSEEATEFVDRLIEEGDGLLTEFYGTETVPPMVCQPRDWVLDDDRLAVGGYLTKAMRERMNIVPRESTHRRLGMGRISEIEAALESINLAQKTEFKVNERMLELQFRSLFKMINDLCEQSLEGILEDGELFISVKEGLEQSLDSLPDPHSLEMWMRQIICAKSLSEDEDIEGRFYHPLRMDHRGRMYTSSTYLDPQGDDFSRGLIRLGRARKLDQEGWKWLRIAVAKLWEGLDNGPEKRSSFEELLEYTEDRDKPFTRMLEKVAQDPIATIDLWSDYRKDIVRAHTEGFQRLSATLAYVDALEAGDDAETDYIAVQDASSNIYQHISLLLRDREMAKLVNVLESESPEDVYLKVADTIPTVEITRLKKDRDRMKEDNCEDYEAKMEVVEVLTEKLASNSSDENRGPTAEETKVAREASKELLSLIATRKHSKSPVMTKGYGSQLRAIEDMLLTHNGKPRRQRNSGRKGSFGKFGWTNKKEGKEEEYIRDFEEIANEAASKIAEISDNIDKILGPIRDYSTRKNHDRGIFYYDRKWRSATRQAVLEALGSHDAEDQRDWKERVISEWEERVDEDSLKSLSQLLEFIGETVWKTCAHNNSILSGVIGEMKGHNQIGEDIHADIAQILAKAFSASIDEVIPNHKLKIKGKFNHLMDETTILRWTTGDRGVRIAHITLSPPKSEPIKRRKSERISDEDEGPVGMLSTRVYSEVRDPNAEGRAIAPNFVHSLDAEHMRQVVRRLCSHQEEQGTPTHIWMVHDAFGCHPNDMGVLREAAAEALAEIHGPRESDGTTYENILDEMHGGAFFEDWSSQPEDKRKGIGTLDISEIQNVDLDRWYFLN